MRRNVNLENIVSPVVTALGYTFEGLNVRSSKSRSHICVYVDKEGGITLGDCEKVNKKLNFILSAEDGLKGDYLLEVSSPGLDRLLFTEEQFKKYIGSELRLTLRVAQDGKRNFKGNLCDVDGDCILVDASGVTYKFPLDDIEWARVVPKW